MVSVIVIESDFFNPQDDCETTPIYSRQPNMLFSPNDGCQAAPREMLFVF